MKTLAPSTTVTTRDRKGRKFMSIVEAAYDKAELDEHEAQRINETPGLSELVSKFIDDNRYDNRYKDEEVPSSYGYLSGYTQPRPLISQSMRLMELFPYFSPTYDEKTERRVPTGAEGHFLIPRWLLFAPTYVEAVKIVLAKLKETRNGAFTNYRENEMTPANLRESARKSEVMATIAEAQQGHNLLVVAAQFGLVHRGRSVRCARVVIGDRGFGLGVFEIGIMLLTHPKRLQRYDELWIQCAGDESNPSGRFEFGHAPSFRFSGGEIEFDDDSVDSVRAVYGIASGLVPQQ